VAPFLWGSGLAGWGATLALATLRRWPARIFAILSAAALTTVAMFWLASPSAISTGGDRLASTETATLALHLLNYLANPLAMVLSSFFVEATARTLARLLTAVALIVFGVWLVDWVRRPGKSRSGFEITALQIVVFCIGVGMLTTLARGHLGPEQAFSPRYSFRTAWAWAIFSGLCSGTAQPTRRFVQTAIIGALMIALLGPAQATGIVNLRGAAEHLRPAYLALLTGVNDRPMLERIFSPSPVLVDLAGRLRHERLAIFSTAPAGWLDRPLEEIFTVQVPPLAARWRVLAVPTDPSGATLEVEGRIEALRARWIVVVSPDGVVRGLGSERQRDEADAMWVRWITYVAAPPPLDGYRIYAVDQEVGIAREMMQGVSVGTGDWQQRRETLTIRPSETVELTPGPSPDASRNQRMEARRRAVDSR
jgi:hypothetical protein